MINAEMKEKTIWVEMR